MTKLVPTQVNMTRAHIRAMMCPKQGRGYAAALKVLKDRKALPEHLVYLEALRKEQLARERRVAVGDSGTSLLSSFEKLGKTTKEAVVPECSDRGSDTARSACTPGCGVCEVLFQTRVQAKTTTRFAALFSPRIIVG